MNVTNQPSFYCERVLLRATNQAALPNELQPSNWLKLAPGEVQALFLMPNFVFSFQTLI